MILHLMNSNDNYDAVVTIRDNGVICQRINNRINAVYSKHQLVPLLSAFNYRGKFDYAGGLMSVDETRANVLISHQLSERRGSKHLLYKTVRNEIFPRCRRSVSPSY
jgi:hypothetical protein